MTKKYYSSSNLGKAVPDLTEKYFRLKIDFPNKANNITSILKAQRRLLARLGHIKHQDDVKSLIMSVAACIEATEAFIDWAYLLIQDVAKDSVVLADSAALRNQLNWNAEILSEMMGAKNEMIEKTIKAIQNGNPLRPNQETA